MKLIFLMFSSLKCSHDSEIKDGKLAYISARIFCSYLQQGNAYANAHEYVHSLMHIFQCKDMQSYKCKCILSLNSLLLLIWIIYIDM